MPLLTSPTPTAASAAPPPTVALRVVAGVVAAFAALGAGHGVAALLNPAASPIVAVGSTLIDAAPTPAKEFAVRTFGTYDKPILISGIGVVLLVVAGVLGMIAWRRRAVAVAGIALLGVVGMVAAVARGTVSDALPSLVAGAVGALVLVSLTRAGSTAGSPGRGGSEPGRRRFLLTLAGGALIGLVGTGGGIVAAQVRRAGSAARRMIGLPAAASPAPPIPDGAQVPGMTPFVTPNDRFYRVDISLVTPSVQTGDWTLTVDGMVERPLTLSYEDLLAMPMIERDITLTCVSNEVGGPYLGTARWLGVPFAEIIRRVGVQQGVDQVFSYSSDSGYTCSTPYQAVSDGRDAMVVVGMNGEPLPDAHGFPARMLVPGLFGFVSATKWLRRIEFTRYADRTAYWTERDWATDAPILTQSRIDVPKSLGEITPQKPILAGVAWAQHRGIAKVEIRIDEGEWEEATLADDAGIDLWRQWTFRYDGPPGLHSAQVRATDLTGATQPEQRRKVFPSGATGWHQIQFTMT